MLISLVHLVVFCLLIIRALPHCADCYTLHSPDDESQENNKMDKTNKQEQKRALPLTHWLPRSTS